MPPSAGFASGRILSLNYGRILSLNYGSLFCFARYNDTVYYAEQNLLPSLLLACIFFSLDIGQKLSVDLLAAAAIFHKLQSSDSRGREGRVSRGDTMIVFVYRYSSCESCFCIYSVYLVLGSSSIRLLNTR